MIRDVYKVVFPIAPRLRWWLAICMSKGFELLLLFLFWLLVQLLLTCCSIVRQIVSSYSKFEGKKKKR